MKTSVCPQCNYMHSDTAICKCGRLASSPPAFERFENAPKDGTIIVVEDAYGEHVDVCKWDGSEWTSVFGVMGDHEMVRWRPAGL